MHETPAILSAVPAPVMPVTNRNTMNKHRPSAATNRNILNIAPVTVCNISELKRTKAPRMTEHINYKALKMNTTPQPQNTIFETRQKSATKRNKRELNRTKILYHQGKQPGSTVVLCTIGDTTEASGVTCLPRLGGGTRCLFL
ncbi:MAG TPA: hypothetical protein VIN07_06500 [Flavipsychrobacter sp.]